MISLNRSLRFLAGFVLLMSVTACAGSPTSSTDLATPLTVAAKEALTVPTKKPLPTATKKALPVAAGGILPTEIPSGPRQVVQPTLAVLQPAGETPQRPAFDTFVAQIKNDNPKQIVGVYVENVLSLRVVQQPQENPSYVSNLKGVATQFALAYDVAGNIGLLAHNYLSGALFFDIKTGDVAQLIYGDGRVDDYEVTEYHEYQALSPDSPTSDFLDLTSGEKLTASDLFNRIYTGEHHLVFQTCISQDNNDTWGRIFVMSFPY